MNKNNQTYVFFHYIEDDKEITDGKRHQNLSVALLHNIKKHVTFLFRHVYVATVALALR